MNRLRALVERAHANGLWIRFYTLDGATKAQLSCNGWFHDYNFGSLDKARVRWRAAIAAHVDYLASDQYELVAQEIHRGRDQREKQMTLCCSARERVKTARTCSEVCFEGSLPDDFGLVSSRMLACPDPICGTTTIPNGRQITPIGDWISVAPFPFALALRPDGRQLVAPSLGFPFALNIIDRPASAEHKVTQNPRGFLSVPGVEFYAGVAYSPDGKLLYLATGDSGAVDVLSMADWHRVARINLNGALQGHIYRESFAASLVLTKDGRRLYVIDQANWRVVVIDTATKTKAATLATGVNPIAICLSPDDKRLYIANSGLFEYKTIPRR